jgi:hypothetical protein
MNLKAKGVNIIKGQMKCGLLFGLKVNTHLGAHELPVHDKCNGDYL